MKTATKPQAITRGNMKPAEIRPLAIAARKAFDYQKHLGIIDGESFDSWRHAQCLQVVCKPGLSACHHEDFRPLLAHFQMLAGDDASAFSNLIKTGKSRDNAYAADTHEERRKIASLISQALTAHATQEPYVVALGNQPIGLGYLVYLARQKTRRPDLTLGSDLTAGLADRCTANQLRQLLYTTTNRIAAAEGRGTSKTRNKSQREK